MIGPSISLAVTLDSMMDATAYTKDLLNLRSIYERVPVFVYGPEKTNFSENYAMQGGEHIGYGLTILNTYEMYTTNHAPIILNNPASEVTGPVFGEVWMVDVPHITNLDSRFCNGVQFNRRTHHVKYYSTRTKDAKVKDWFISEMFIYTGINEYWSKPRQVDKTLTLLKRQQPKDGQPYFLFSKLEDFQPQRRTM